MLVVEAKNWTDSDRKDENLYCRNAEARTRVSFCLPNKNRVGVARGGEYNLEVVYISLCHERSWCMCLDQSSHRPCSRRVVRADHIDRGHQQKGFKGWCTLEAPRTAWVIWWQWLAAFFTKVRQRSLVKREKVNFDRRNDSITRFLESQLKCLFRWLPKSEASLL